MTAAPIPPKLFTAIEAVLYIACRQGAEPVRSKDICEYQGVKLRYLEQILQSLVREGILKSIRGPKGGYVLARDRRKILLSDIYTAIQGLCQAESLSHSPLQQRILQPLSEKLKTSVTHQLGTVTLLDLCTQAQDADCVSTLSKPDFTI